MPIPVKCPSCGTVLAAPESAAGKRAKCRSCQAILTIPHPDDSGLEILDEPAVVPPVPAAFVPQEVPPPAAFRFDEPAPKPKKRAISDDDDDDRPRRKRRRDDDDDDDDRDERPRSRKAVKEKKDNTLLYVAAAAMAVLLIVGVGGFGFWYFVIREPKVAEVTAPLKPKPTFATKPTVKTAPNGWEIVDDNDLQALFPKAGILEKEEGKIAKIEDYPDLAEARVVTKIMSRDPLYIIYAYVIYIRSESLAKVKAKPSEAIGDWVDLFLIKFPMDDVAGPTEFKNTEFSYQGKSYICKDEAGMKHFFRMFIAHDKFYVLHVIGDGLNERSENVKTFFDNFNPTR